MMEVNVPELLDVPDSPVANEFLKMSFRRVHDKIVDSINVGSIIDQLFSCGVIGVDDYRSLTNVKVLIDPTSQCRRLMSILYTSSHPEAFVMLRRALNKEAAYQWLVKLVDEQFKQIVVIDPEPEEDKDDKSEIVIPARSVKPNLAHLLIHKENLKTHGKASDSMTSTSSGSSSGSSSGFSSVYSVESDDVDGVSSMKSLSITTTSSTVSSPMMPSPDEASPSVSPPPEPSTVEVPSVPVLLPCVSLIASFDAPSPTPSSASPIIGSVSSPISPLSPSGAVPYKRRALPLANLRIDGRGGVRGVAEFRGQLFVVVESSDVVHVYSRTQTISCPYVRSDPFRVKGLKSPTDVVACRDTEQLYVADGAKRCVWRIDTKTITQRQSAVASDCWLKTPDFEPQTLSVRMRRVVVTSEASAWLHLYRTDGKLVKRIPLPDGTAALHAVETDRETFVVSLVRRGVKSRCQISEIDCNGIILRAFDGGRDGNREQVIDDASYLALDSDGRVLVADTGNDRIVLLNCDLNFERVLLNWKENCLERRPWRMYLMEQSAQLVIGHYETRVVALYRVRPK